MRKSAEDSRLLLAEGTIRELDIFEQRGDFGGTWNYSSPETQDDLPSLRNAAMLRFERPKWQSGNAILEDGDNSRHAIFSTPMYDGLETNIPTSLMSHSDNKDLQHCPLFPTRQEVLSYLRQCAIPVAKHVKFHTQVRDIGLVRHPEHDSWNVAVLDLISGLERSQIYDGVVVCTGHHATPNIPDIPGLQDWQQSFPGTILHSKSYRSNSKFKNKKVVIVGNSASGTDIARHIGEVARRPVLVAARSDNPLSYNTTFTEFRPAIKSITASSRAVTFEDGMTAMDVDNIIFCTGYLYTFPFLSTLSPAVVTTGDRVMQLYKHMFYAPHPSLSFIGLLSRIIPFRTFESQAAVIARVLAGRLDLPSLSQMCTWEQDLLENRGAGRAFHVMRSGEDFAYHNELLRWAATARDEEERCLPPEWSQEDSWQRARFPAIRQAYIEHGQLRRYLKSLAQLGFDYSAWLSEHTDQASPAH